MRSRVSLGLLWLLVSGGAWAHGIEIAVTVEGTQLFGEVRESRGPAIAGMRVSVSRANEVEPFLESVSDAAGRFRFAVDPEQAYRVVADDGLGHRAVAGIAPTTTGSSSRSSTATSRARWIDASMGLGAIAALAVLAGWVIRRRGLR